MPFPYLGNKPTKLLDQSLLNSRYPRLAAKKQGHPEQTGTDEQKACRLRGNCDRCRHFRERGRTREIGGYTRQRTYVQVVGSVEVKRRSRVVHEGCRRKAEGRIGRGYGRRGCGGQAYERRAHEYFSAILRGDAIERQTVCQKRDALYTACGGIDRRRATHGVCVSRHAIENTGAVEVKRSDGVGVGECTRIKEGKKSKQTT